MYATAAGNIVIGLPSKNIFLNWARLVISSGITEILLKLKFNVTSWTICSKIEGCQFVNALWETSSNVIWCMNGCPKESGHSCNCHLRRENDSKPSSTCANIFKNWMAGSEPRDITCSGGSINLEGSHLKIWNPMSYPLRNGRYPKRKGSLWIGFSSIVNVNNPVSWEIWLGKISMQLLCKKSLCNRVMAHISTGIVTNWLWLSFAMVKFWSMLISGGMVVIKLWVKLRDTRAPIHQSSSKNVSHPKSEQSITNVLPASRKIRKHNSKSSSTNVKLTRDLHPVVKFNRQISAAQGWQKKRLRTHRLFHERQLLLIGISFRSSFCCVHSGQILV